MKGKIVQVSGPVVDVEFEGSYLPAIKDALYVIQDGKKKTLGSRRLWLRALMGTAIRAAVI